MQNNTYLLSFDAGTGAGRCSIFDLDGKLVATSYQEWDYYTPDGLTSSAKEFSPDKFWNIFTQLSKEVLETSGVHPESITAVSTTSQREGMVFLDELGNELYAGPNIDDRGTHEYGPFLACQDEIRAITGLKMFSLYGPARLLWFKENNPAIYEKISTILMISDWIAYRLSGITSSTPTIASSSQLFDIQSGIWSEEIVRIFDLRDDFFPEIYSAGTVLGTITPKAAQETGLSEKTKVVVGGGDTHLGLLGLGIVSAGEYGAIAGTSTPVMGVIDAPSIDPEKRVSTSSYAVSELWTLESNAGMTGLPYRWVRDTFAEGVPGSDNSYEELNKLAAEIPVGSAGWNAFLGSGIAGSNHYNLGGFLFPLDWTLSHFSLGNLVRSSIETMVFGVVGNLKQLTQITGDKPEAFHVGGGQTKSPLFNQMLADSVNLPVHIYQTKESTSLGAAICAAVGNKHFNTFSEAMQSMVTEERIYTPDPINIQAYKEVYEKWLDLNSYINQYKFKEK